MFERVVEIIKEHSKFLITTHINPDGDGLGSEIALATILRMLGKEVVIINQSPVPENYMFLNRDKDIKIFSKADINLIKEFEIIFVVDISNWERVGELGSYLTEAKGIKICIDHHPSNVGFADINIIDERASSTGELIYELAKSLEVTLNEKAAAALYVAIVTDTGSFRFSNTTPKTHLIISELLALGIKPEQIYEEIYEKRSASRMRVLGLALSNLNVEFGGKVAWFYVTQRMMREFGLKADETDGFVNLLSNINGVMVSIFFLELGDKKVKVSLRSKGNVDVNAIANSLNGGGHFHAAGIIMEDSLKEAIKKVLGVVEKEFV